MTGCRYRTTIRLWGSVTSALCLRAVDPPGERAWTCGACHKPLARRPGSWLQHFKVARPAMAEMQDSWLAELRSTDGKNRSLSGGSEPHESPAADQSAWRLSLSVHSQNYWRSTFLYENACALWETLAHEHRNCASAEVTATMTQYVSAELPCPVAAGMLRAMSQSGARLEPRGNWQRCRPSADSASALSVPASLPDWATAAYVWELGRLRVLDAVESLALLAETGRRRCFWRMPMTKPPIDHLKTGVLLSGLATEAQLLKAFQWGAKSCPNL